MDAGDAHTRPGSGASSGAATPASRKPDPKGGGDRKERAGDIDGLSSDLRDLGIGGGGFDNPNPLASARLVLDEEGGDSAQSVEPYEDDELQDVRDAIWGASRLGLRGQWQRNSARVSRLLFPSRSSLACSVRSSLPLVTLSPSQTWCPRSKTPSLTTRSSACTLSPSDASRYRVRVTPTQWYA